MSSDKKKPIAPASNILEALEDAENRLWNRVIDLQSVNKNGYAKALNRVDELEEQLSVAKKALEAEAAKLRPFLEAMRKLANGADNGAAPKPQAKKPTPKKPPQKKNPEAPKSAKQNQTWAQFSASIRGQSGGKINVFLGDDQKQVDFFGKQWKAGAKPAAALKLWQEKHCDVVPLAGAKAKKASTSKKKSPAPPPAKRYTDQDAMRRATFSFEGAESRLEDFLRKRKGNPDNEQIRAFLGQIDVFGIQGIYNGEGLTYSYHGGKFPWLRRGEKTYKGDQLCALFRRTFLKDKASPIAPTKKLKNVRIINHDQHPEQKYARNMQKKVAAEIDAGQNPKPAAMATDNWLIFIDQVRQMTGGTVELHRGPVPPELWSFFQNEWKAGRSSIQALDNWRKQQTEKTVAAVLDHGEPRVPTSLSNGDLRLPVATPAPIEPPKSEPPKSDNPKSDNIDTWYDSGRGIPGQPPGQKLTWHQWSAAVASCADARNCKDWPRAKSDITIAGERFWPNDLLLSPETREVRSAYLAGRKPSHAARELAQLYSKRAAAADAARDTVSDEEKASLGKGRKVGAA